ncbi:Rpn family recombination-promoting nuclease/putative transposase [Bacteroides sp. 519]|uniref:Rpn family recombination-promoting nuclease/putative transposase n=1 Tax=Bacteroides sp. 519 TaxID=2302937 RepID=UPI0013D6CFAD|nr:Rpn family recombination-promoting nuclease/putative transposase [Bacteroides sp. 519]NDV58676.1 Rpn family recombination-promoting nuclease/putative transposase [Bacteroides sp. 519]
MGSEGLIEKYINPYTDFGFKKLFGTELNKDLLISFLNSLLPDGQVIKDVTYLNAEQLGTLEADRRAVFDVYCENEQGEKFLVEMQKGEQQFFKDRSLFYTTFPIREQAVKGRSWNYELKAVYTVGILNFAFDNNSNDYFHHEVKLVDMGTQEVFYDKLTLIYLEMPKFNKTEYELENMFDKWMFVLRNLSRLMERPAALQERIFTRLFEAAEIARFNRKELVEYEDSLKNFRDWYSVMETSLNKGRAEGLAEGLEKGLEKGRAEGRTEGLLEVARKMKSNNIPIQTIQELTGLSLKEIEKL